MKDFIDKTNDTAGTPFNRKNMLAIQGFIGNTVSINDDGTVTVINDEGEKEMITYSNGTITEQFTGEKTVTNTVSFPGDGTMKGTLI